MSLSGAVSSIDSWFHSKCDGNWEHQAGITIETTDNPGWWMTFDNYSIESPILSELAADILREYGANVDMDGVSLRVFARSLNSCLQAAAAIIDAGKQIAATDKSKRRGKRKR